jgi:hypothetical protein
VRETIISQPVLVTATLLFVLWLSELLVKIMNLTWVFDGNVLLFFETQVIAQRSCCLQVTKLPRHATVPCVNLEASPWFTGDSCC